MSNYLAYYLPALTKYKVHSPFVYKFMTEIFEDKRHYHFFDIIENYRRNLMENGTQISIKEGTKTISQLAKSTEIEAKYGQILFKAIHQYKPVKLVELGTGLGIASLYQATPNTKMSLITIEEEINIAQQTKGYFKQLSTQNITILEGSIETNLSKVINHLTSIDFLFINGFWGVNITKNYFEACLKVITPNSVFVFNAPYTNKETLTFWQEIKRNEAVKLSIDIYGLGFLFFRLEQKEIAHYQIIEYWKKPWAIF